MEWIARSTTTSTARPTTRPGLPAVLLKRRFGAPYAAPICNQSITLPGRPDGQRLRAQLAEGRISRRTPTSSPTTCRSVRRSRRATHTSLPSIYSAPGYPAASVSTARSRCSTRALNSYQNDTGITKLQYTHALSQSAYLRAYGYTFYSDWLQDRPLFGATGQRIPRCLSPEYELITHTVGRRARVQRSNQRPESARRRRQLHAPPTSTRFNNTSAIAGARHVADRLHVRQAAVTSPATTAHQPAAAKPCRVRPAATTTSILGTFVNPNAVYTGAPGACDAPSRAFRPGPCGWRSNAIARADRIRRPGQRVVGFAVDRQRNGSFNTVQPRFHQRGDQRSMATERQVPDQRLATLRQLHLRLARFGRRPRPSSTPT